MAGSLTIDGMHQVALTTSDINRSTEFYRDALGQFGAAGEEEWMAFFRDPDGNLPALASRKHA